MRRMNAGSRRRWAAGLTAAVGGFLLWTAASRSVAQMRLPVRPPRAVLTETEAFVLGEAQALAGPIVQSVSPMPDGPFAIVVRNVPDDPQRALADAEGNRPFRNGQVQVLLWNRRTGRVSVMWRKRADDRVAIAMSPAEWLPGSDTAILQPYFAPQESQGSGAPGQEIPSPVLLVSTRSTAARTVPVEPGVFFQVAPRHPFALLQSLSPDPTAASAQRASARVLRPDGTVSGPITLPQGYNFSLGISEDGTHAYAVRTLLSEDTPPRRTRQYAAVRLSDGAITTLEKRPVFRPAGIEDEIEKLPVRLVARGATLSDEGGRKASVQAVWLERAEPSDTKAARTPTGAGGAPAPAAVPSAPGGTPGGIPKVTERERRALVTADGEAVTLMPDGSAALYLTSDGTLMAAPITRVPARAYRDGQREMHRLKTMQNAKQIGLGMLMDAQDYDETLPPSGDLANVVNPYLRDSDVFQNPATGEFSFRYTGPAGGKLGSVERPAETVLGYLDGPGGRAVLYADGHVKWEDDPKGE